VSRYPGLNATDIEYVDFSLNIYVGCRCGCRDFDGRLYCYARQIVEESPWRERHHWPKKFTDVSCYPERLQTLLKLAGYKRRDGRRARIFLSDMCDMFAPWTPQYPVSVRDVMRAIRQVPQHDFLLLTKSYERLAHVESTCGGFPENAWVGVTIDRASVCRPALRALSEIRAAVKWVSFEPLLGDALGGDPLSGVDWAVVGALTGPHGYLPEAEWRGNILRSADAAGIRVFEKDNLKLKAPRREFPAVAPSSEAGHLRRTGEAMAGKPAGA